MKNLKNYLLIILCISFSFDAVAQNKALKVGDTPTLKDPSTVFEIESANKGVLLPRVALTGLNDVTTITPTATGAAHSLTVFNTVTAGIGANKITPGYYYWSKDLVTPTNSTWVRILDTKSDDWHILGNYSTIAPTVYSGTIGSPTTGNFIGTDFVSNPSSTNQDLQFRTNGIDAMRINAKNQHIAFGNNHGVSGVQNADVNFDGTTGNASARVAIREKLDFTTGNDWIHTGGTAIAPGPYRTFLNFLELKANLSTLNAQAIQSSFTFEGTASQTIAHIFNAIYTGGGTLGTIVAAQGTTIIKGGTISVLAGGGNFPVDINGGTVAGVYGFRAQVNNNGGTITGSARGSESSIKINSGTATGDVIGHDITVLGTDATIPGISKGLQINDVKTTITPSVGTEQYSIYQNGADDINYFAGQVSIGNLTPDADIKLDVVGQMKVGTKAGESGPPSHVAPAGTIIFQSGNFYGNLDGTAGGWTQIDN